ncbi:MAG: hypothetical protein AB1801_26415, partial [Chloroflexota bacterium]
KIPPSPHGGKGVRGMGVSSYDFSGLRLQNLNIVDGASTSEIRFDSVTPVEMAQFNYRSGASTVTRRGWPTQILQK